MQNNELLKAYHQGERNFGGLKLQGINLGGADLIEIIFSESNRHWYRLARSYKRCNTGGSRNQANLE
jgi:hypothetical protein